jgi:protease IV
MSDFDNNENSGAGTPPPPPPSIPPQAPYPPNMGGIPPYPPPHYQRPSSGSRWWVPVVIILGAIGLFIFTIIAFFTYAGSKIADLNFESAEETSVIDEKSVLYLTYSNGAAEYTKENPFSAFSGKKSKSSFLSTLSAIERASEDDDISGIYLKPKGRIPLPRALELNEAVKDFKESGKFVYAFIEYGDENTYLSALPADSIFMPREGLLEMNGYGINAMFMKGMFKKLGVEFHVEQFEDFKSAGEQMSRTSFSDSARYQLQVLLDQRFDALLSEISEHRNMSKEFVREVMARGVFTADSIMELGFIDAYSTESNFKDFMEIKLFGEVSKADDDDDEDEDEHSHGDEENNKLKLISASKYMASGPSSSREIADDDKQIAIIYGTGPIYSGKGKSGFNLGDDPYEIRSGKYIEYLKKAREDDDVKVIVLRIDSPGGSVIASDEIWEEIQKTKKVKPVIASMSSVAASGGYYMAMACDKIIAHPETITGSIGVILQIPNLSGIANMVGITADTISTGPAAQFLNGMYPYTKSDLSKLRLLSSGIYRRFVSKMAESRGKTFDEARALAKGRVWTGRDAKDRGLVDELGGMKRTLEIAKEMIGVDPKKLVSLRTFPEKKDSFEELIKSFLGEEDVEISSSIAESLGLNPVELLASWNGLSDEQKAQLKYAASLFEMTKTEKAIVALPGNAFMIGQF